jgi:hypothetical protein
MTFDGTVGPLGSLDDSEQILKKLEDDLKNNSLPIIKCNKEFCRCGLCAPKAESTELYNQIMTKYVIPKF